MMCFVTVMIKYCLMNSVISVQLSGSLPWPAINDKRFPSYLPMSLIEGVNNHTSSLVACRWEEVKFCYITSAWWVNKLVVRLLSELDGKISLWFVFIWMPCQEFKVEPCILRLFLQCFKNTEENLSWLRCVSCVSLIFEH